jgi:copper transport protein
VVGPLAVLWILGAIIGGMVGGTVLALASAAPASAHASLVRTDPAEGAIVETQPSAVTLVFNEPVGTGLGRVNLIGPDGKRIAIEPRRGASDREVTTPLPAGLARGTYLVSYRVTSADSHPVSGSVAFSIGFASPDRPVDDTATDTDPAVASIFATVRSITYAGLFALVGAVVVLLSLWPARLSASGPIRVMWAGWAAVTAGSAAQIVLQAPYASGQGLVDGSVDWPAEIDSVLASTFGQANLVRIAVLAGMLPLLVRLARGRRVDLPGRLVLGALGLVTIGSFPMAGHPATAPAAALAMLIDALHLAAGSLWIGGLVVLAAFLLPAAREAELGLVMPTWSRWAASAVGTLVLTGMAQAVLQIGGVSALIGTSYGRLVLVKVGLLAVVLGLAAVARAAVRQRWLLPAASAHSERTSGTTTDLPTGTPVESTAGTPVEAPDEAPDDADPAGAAGIGKLRRSMVAEVMLAVLVIGVTGALVQTTPARTAAATAPRGPVSVALTAPDLAVQVDVDPATVGNNTVHVVAYDASGAEKRVVEWRVSMALPAQGIEPFVAEVLPLDRNHAIASVQLPVTGEWQLALTLRTSEIDQVTLRATVTVR